MMPTKSDRNSVTRCLDPYKRGCKRFIKRSMGGKDFLIAARSLESRGWRRCEYNNQWVCPGCVKSRLPFTQDRVAILKHSDMNSCYLDVVMLSNADEKLRAAVAVDLKRGTYGGERRTPIGQTMRVGERIIGVYDCTDPYHLQHMVSRSQESSRGVSYDD